MPLAALQRCFCWYPVSRSKKPGLRSRGQDSGPGATAPGAHSRMVRVPPPPARCRTEAAAGHPASTVRKPVPFSFTKGVPCPSNFQMAKLYLVIGRVGFDPWSFGYNEPYSPKGLFFKKKSVRTPFSYMFGSRRHGNQIISVQWTNLNWPRGTGE